MKNPGKIMRTHTGLLLLFWVLFLLPGAMASGELEMPGVIEGTGSFFEVTDSAYLNITLASTEMLHLMLHSVPEMIVLGFEAAAGAPSSEITLCGFPPSTTFYMYEDDYHNLVVFTSDQNGSHVYTQDLSRKHLVFIQPSASTIYLSSSGWSDPTVGTWDPSTQTGTLTTDLSEIVQIDSDGITLDGNGHTITGKGFGGGVYLSGRTGVTVKNVNTRKFNSGIGLIGSSHNTLIGNSASGCSYGIWVQTGSSHNTLIDNTVFSNNLEGIYFYGGSNSNSVSGTFASDNRVGISVLYSDNNTFTGNTFFDNNNGIYFYKSYDNEIFNNNFKSNRIRQALVFQCTGNSFSLPPPVGGNFWSDWTGPDSDGDGIVDDPYLFGGGQDDLPWTAEDGWQEPQNQIPIAVAGDDQSVHQGSLVTLDGSGSHDPDGDPIAFFWEITSDPPDSTAVLSDPFAIGPSFVANKSGDYVIELVVTDSKEAESDPDSVTVSTTNAAPVADAGDDQAIVEIGTTVDLDGSASYDPEGDDMTFAWIMQKPAGSLAALSDPASESPFFVADVHGDYVLELTVTDEFGAESDPDLVTVSFENVQPVAVAKWTFSGVVEDAVFVDGSDSYDANSDLLSYSWSITSKPAGSSAEVSDTIAAQTSFIPDLPGEYLVSLVVNDGFEDSEPDNVTIVAITSQEAATIELFDAIAKINDDPTLGREHWRNKNLRKAMTNKINAVLKMIDDELYEDAWDKLSNDILHKMDGCYYEGEPDKNDWLVTCTGQETLFPLITNAMGLVENLMD